MPEGEDGDPSHTWLARNRFPHPMVQAPTNDLLQCIWTYDPGFYPNDTDDDSWYLSIQRKAGQLYWDNQWKTGDNFLTRLKRVVKKNNETMIFDENNVVLRIEPGIVNGDNHMWRRRE